MKTDELPHWVSEFVQAEAAADPLRGAKAGEHLLDAFVRHTRHMTRSYPDAWFADGLRNDDDGVADLAHRTFTVCARKVKGRFPFSGRTPFICYTDERFDGRTVRYHSFYAKLSIARELMRDDYAKNLVRDPVLRWRAELYREVRATVKSEAVAESQGAGLPPRFRLQHTTGLRALRPIGAVEARLKAAQERSVAVIVRTALSECGPLTASRLTHLAEAVLGTPEAHEPAPPVVAAAQSEQVGLRRAVQDAWDDLESADQQLLIAVARGEAYADLVRRHPRFKHKVAVTRAVTRCGEHFMARLSEEAGTSTTGVPKGVRPRDLIELVLSVLAEMDPNLMGPAGGEA